MALTKTLSEKSTDASVTKSTGGDKREKPFTKVIVRRLPPNMSQDEFLLQVSPIPDYDYIYSVKGDMSLGESSFTRVYINFIQIDDVYTFKEKFDNYVFLDEKGHEYSAVVEYASFQKIPKLRKKPKSDPKCGSIESDQIYLDFVHSLNESNENQDEKPEFSFQPTIETKNEVNTTPLLDFLKQRKLERQKLREEKRDERRRKDLERKRIRDEDRKKRTDEKVSPKKDQDRGFSETIEQEEVRSKPSTSDRYFENSNKDTNIPSKDTRFKEKRYEDKSFVNSKLKKQHKFDDKSRNRRDRDEFKTKEYKNKTFEPKNTIVDNREIDPQPDSSKIAPRKVKKYSERREERKTESRRTAQPDNQPISDLITNQSTDGLLEHMEANCSPTGAGNKENKDRIIEQEDDDVRPERKTLKNRENDPRAQRRIRNKDRPTMALYQPGMLKKKTDSSTSIASTGINDDITTLEE